MKLLLPTSYTGPRPEFDQAENDPVQVIDYDANGTVPAEHRDAEVLVVWGQGPELLPDAAENMTNLKLVQALLAGPDPILAAGFAPEIPITTGVGLHDGPVTEQTLGMLLYMVRSFPQALAAQKAHEWDSELSGTQPLRGEDGRALSLIGANVTIWGFGSIGKNLAGVLKSLGASVTGVARSEGERAGFPVVTEDSLPELLPRTDVLIMILPRSEATTDALDAERLALLPDHAYVVNVGRGTTVDEDALLETLNAGRLAGVALDVTKTEPLPADSPLWDAPRTFITPHSAGGRPVGAEKLIEHNVAALRAGTELKNLASR